MIKSYTKKTPHEIFTNREPLRFDDYRVAKVTKIVTTALEVTIDDMRQETPDGLLALYFIWWLLRYVCCVDAADISDLMCARLTTIIDGCERITECANVTGARAILHMLSGRVRKQGIGVE